MLCNSSIAEYFPVDPRSSQLHDDEHMLVTLKAMFPSVNVEIIGEAVRDSFTTEDAVEVILILQIWTREVNQNIYKLILSIFIRSISYIELWM